MEYILHIPQCVARFPFIPRGRRLHIGSIRARAGCPCLAPAIDGSWRSLGTVRTLCRQWVLDTRLAYGLPLCPGSNGRPRCFSAVLSADRSRLASSSISADPHHRPHSAPVSTQLESIAHRRSPKNRLLNRAWLVSRLAAQKKKTPPRGRTGFSQHRTAGDRGGWVAVRPIRRAPLPSSSIGAMPSFCLCAFWQRRCE